MGPLVFTTQCLQDPVPAHSCLVQWNKIARHEEPPPRHLIERVVQQHADYSACGTFGFYEGWWYLLDTLRFRADFAALKDRVLAHREAWKADVVVIEDVASGWAPLSSLN